MQNTVIEPDQSCLMKSIAGMFEADSSLNAVSSLDNQPTEESPALATN